MVIKIVSDESYVYTDEWHFDVKHGRSTMYDKKRGKMLVTRNYWLGKKHGEETLCLTDGTVIKTHYINDLKHGPQVVIRDEKAVRMTDYCNDFKHGVQTDFVDGEITLVTEFQHGKKHGAQVEFDTRTKKVKQIVPYRHDRVSGFFIKLKDGTNSVEELTDYNNGVRDGGSIVFRGAQMYAYEFDNGTRIWSMMYDTNRKPLSEKSYYPNGSLKSHVWYGEDGEVTGRRVLNEDGSLNTESSTQQSVEKSKKRKSRSEEKEKKSTKKRTDKKRHPVKLKRTRTVPVEEPIKSKGRKRQVNDDEYEADGQGSKRSRNELPALIRLNAVRVVRTEP